MDSFYNHKIFLAPMAGVTDLPFRIVCREFGADAVYSEMVSAKGIHYKDKKTHLLLESAPEEAPLIVQIFGSEPEIMAEAAEYVERQGFTRLDINMGCPTPKIVSNGDGCALDAAAGADARCDTRRRFRVPYPSQREDPFRLGRRQQKCCFARANRGRRGGGGNCRPRTDAQRLLQRQSRLGYHKICERGSVHPCHWQWRHFYAGGCTGGCLITPAATA